MTELSPVQARSRRARRKPQRGLLTQALLLAFSTALGQVIVAVLYICTARIEGPEAFGPVVAAIAVGSTLAGFIDFGSNSFWVRQIATSKMDLMTLGNGITGKLAMACIICLIWGTANAIVAPALQLWIAAPIAISIVLSQSFAVPLRAAGRSDLVAVGAIVDRAAAAIFYTFLLILGVEASLALWTCLTAGPVIASALTRWVLSGALKPQMRLILRHNPWKGSRHYGLSSAAVSAQTLDLTIMNLIAGPTAAGLYGAVNRWTQPMTLLAGAFTTSSAPIVARAASWKQAWPQVRRSAWLLAGAVLTCIIVALLADPLVTVLVGPEYDDSGGILQVLALGTIGAVLNLPVASFLQSLGRDRVVSAIITTGVVVQLALVACLSLQYGALGASLAFCVLQGLILISLVIAVFAKRQRPLSPAGRHFRNERRTT
ncbi:lipopolysaccharide biosynthesis protein [Pseudarthrobacter oxydans]|uniref:lipopolysaccharide biosynthesis protein n=1 Tax=Pseudarthrobacter oxydans TaxID=1671 RepID=UPI003802E7A7